MPITDWPEHDRPRERLLNKGPGSLSDAELLAIFLRMGVRGKTAVDLAQELLSQFRSLRELFNAPLSDFSGVKGFGPAKYVQLRAVHEMARRALEQELRETPVSLSSPTAVRSYLSLVLGTLPHEVFMVIFLDAQNRVLHHEELFRGTLTQTTVHPREVVKRALAHNAAAVILAHNHPSGVAEPSRSDELLTRTLRDALALVEVRVLDHFVVGAGQTVSFAERGLL